MPAMRERLGREDARPPRVAEQERDRHRRRDHDEDHDGETTAYATPSALRYRRGNRSPDSRTFANTTVADRDQGRRRELLRDLDVPLPTLSRPSAGRAQRDRDDPALRHVPRRRHHVDGRDADPEGGHVAGTVASDSQERGQPVGASTTRARRSPDCVTTSWPTSAQTPPPSSASHDGHDLGEYGGDEALDRDRPELQGAAEQGQRDAGQHRRRPRPGRGRGVRRPQFRGPEGRPRAAALTRDQPRRRTRLRPRPRPRTRCSGSCWSMLLGLQEVRGEAQVRRAGRPSGSRSSRPRLRRRPAASAGA